MTTEISTQLDFATLALKGKRYSEAENIYTNLAIQHALAEAWVGLGICKMYQLAEDKTIDEVIFCFDKAIAVNSNLKNEIEEQFCIHAGLVLKAYSDLAEKLAAEFKSGQIMAGIGLALTAVSAIAGNNSKGTFNTVASLAGAGAGVGIAVDSFNQIGDTKEALLKIVAISCSLYENTLTLIQNNTNLTQQFENSFREPLNSMKELRVRLSTGKSIGANAGQIDESFTIADGTKMIYLMYGIHKFRNKEILKGLLYASTIGGFGLLAYSDLMKMKRGTYIGYNLYTKSITL